MSNLNVEGIDYAWGNPNYDAIKRAGKKFVMTYVSHTPSKDLQAEEFKQYAKRDMYVGVVFETTAGRATTGKAAGIQDAKDAEQHVNALGLKGIPIYFAVDVDTSGANVASYFQGTKSVLGLDRNGAYGSYNVVKYLKENKLIDWVWQTYAWSGGQVYSETDVYQYHNGASVGGLSCDLDKASERGLKSMRPAKVPPAPPPPNPDLPKLKDAIALLRKARGLVGKVPGLQTAIDDLRHKINKG